MFKVDISTNTYYGLINQRTELGGHKLVGLGWFGITENTPIMEYSPGE